MFHLYILTYNTLSHLPVQYNTSASQIVERSPLAEPVADAMGVAIFSHDLPYYWAMFFYYGNGYWQKGIPAQPEDMDAYKALENKIMEKYDLKEPFIWT